MGAGVGHVYDVTTVAVPPFAFLCLFQGVEAKDLFMIDGRCCDKPYITGYTDINNATPVLLYCASCQKFMWCTPSVFWGVSSLDDKFLSHPLGRHSGCRFIGIPNLSRLNYEENYLTIPLVRLPPHLVASIALGPEFAVYRFGHNMAVTEWFAEYGFIPPMGVEESVAEWKEMQAASTLVEDFCPSEWVLSWMMGTVLSHTEACSVGAVLEMGWAGKGPFPLEPM
jgi:hypothetical protein